MSYISLLLAAVIIQTSLQLARLSLLHFEFDWCADYCVEDKICVFCL